MIPTPCPGCSKTLQVPDKYAGRKVKCPKCSHSVLVPVAEPDPTFDDDLLGPDDEDMDYAPTPSPTKRKGQRAPSSKASSTTTNSKGKSLSIPIVCGIATACLVVGFFSGRWHLQWVIKGRLDTLSSAIADGIKSGVGDTAMSATSQPEPEDEEPIPRVAIGEAHQTPGFAIKAVAVDVTTPEVESFSGAAKLDSDCLVVTVSITNTDQRKILRLQPENMLSNGHCWVVDDAGNQIRGIDTSRPIIGALSTSADINPSDTVLHKFLFKVPPPKTESLVVTLDLDSMFEFDGKLAVDVPSNRITGFASQ